MKMMRFIGVGALALSLLACGTEDPADPGTEAGAFKEGNFQLTTHAVTDVCDAGLDLLFKPESDKPSDLANLTRLPTWSTDLKETYDIALQAPFDKMTVTVEADGEGAMKVVDAKQTAVVVDADQFGDCTADMNFNALITLVDDNNVSLTVTVGITNWTGDQCPKTDACEVKLTMKGVRK